MGERAGAFEDASDLEAELEAVETLIERVAAAREEAGDLAATLPELRGALDDLADSGDGDD